ncbi:malate synthase A [Tellurirhabdus rosea]|uniref:malate synthase A n=1 Tax=Tellurirhabdus rosea TaxID=2674997 RepID=UPI002259EF55|nr:malate synthase A [Tellurirhabdus rosea]
MSLTETLNDTLIRLSANLSGGYEEILTPEALAFLAELHRRFEPARRELLTRRQERERRIDAGELPDFLTETAEIRRQDWQAAPYPANLQDRRTEITGPVDRKMIVNALNSGARVFMADFEDANSPTWDNLLQGQINLRDAIRRQIDFTAENGKTYALKPQVAVLKVRPRGWHLTERHLTIDGQPVSGSLFDFGLYFFHNAHELLRRGSGPYFYLPKLESHREARLWNEVFVFAQEYVGLPVGTIKVTVLIETILASFEMDEIIYELRDHIAGLNAGRWDYIFSFIKKLKAHPAYLLPDRSQVTMQSPFMRAYAQLLVQTCHKRGIHAIGGMAAFIPNRKDPKINQFAFDKVKADKELEAATGFDGTWVAHPDLVPVAMAPFNAVLGDRPNQKEKRLSDLSITARDLLNPTIPGSSITEAGLRMNINVGILYIESWLRGVGAAAIHNLMEDAATSEISRAQVWQWLRHGAKTYDGRPIDVSWYKQVLFEEIEAIRRSLGSERYNQGRFREAARLFDGLVTQESFDAFLTLGAYEMIE